MTENDLPTWLTEGAEVAIYNSGRGLGGGAGSVTLTKVTKIQKLHVITENGGKFRRRDLNSIAQRGSWDSADVLKATDDPAVIATLKAADARQAVLILTNLTNRLRLRSGDPNELLREVEQIRDAATTAHTRLLRIIES